MHQNQLAQFAMDPLLNSESAKEMTLSPGDFQSHSTKLVDSGSELEVLYFGIGYRKYHHLRPEYVVRDIPVVICDGWYTH